MQWSMYTIQYTLQWSIYTIQWSMYNGQSEMYIIIMYSIVYSLNFTLYNIRCDIRVKMYNIRKFFIYRLKVNFYRDIDLG